MPPAVQDAWTPRPMCARCRRPVRVCYCAALPTLDTETRVVILQHPRERDMPIGTARMASLALPQAELHVGVRWDGHPALSRALADPARPPVLLYPAAGAKDILREPPAGPVTLVVVDGTWSQARSVVRDNPVLQALPRYAFATPEPSQYRIRREPRAEYVSTIEALMHVLGVLERDAERFRALLAPLHAMVDAQLECREVAAKRTSYRRPRTARPLRARLPRVLTERFEDLVCVVGEANAWPYERGVEHPTHELIHWVAHRPASGETFDVVARPAGPLAPNTLFHVALDGERVLAGGTQRDLIDAFAAWTRASDVVCAWGTFGLELFAASGGVLAEPPVDIKTAAQRLRHEKIGSLESLAASLPAAAPLATGRAGRRLAVLVELVRSWQAI